MESNREPSTTHPSFEGETQSGGVYSRSRCLGKSTGARKGGTQTAGSATEEQEEARGTESAGTESAGTEAIKGSSKWEQEATSQKGREGEEGKKERPSEEIVHPIVHRKAQVDVGMGDFEEIANLRELVADQQREIEILRRQLNALNTSSASNLEQGKEKVSLNVVERTSLSSAGLFNSKEERVSIQASADQAVALAFPALLRGLTSKEDAQNVQSICQKIVGDGAFGNWETLFKSFYKHVVSCRDSLPPEVIAMERSLLPDWYRDPWYLMYVQWTGVEETASRHFGGFDSLCEMLPYIRDELGFRNICLLPHYESPMADGGYDVSDYMTRASLGGEEAFKRFMQVALKMGLRVVTDAVFNHTSTEHPWFQKALAGEEKYIAYYVQRNGREKIGEWDRNGDIICRYRDPDGTITERVVVFPDVDRTHGLWVEINGKTYQFYRSFFPFQIDLNLQNPEVIEELFQILSAEIRQGILGKRMDAMAHWIKKPGCGSEGVPECHAVQALIKCFLKHVNRRCIVMPEVVRDMNNAATYEGMRTRMNGVSCGSEGDAILCFDMQAALREMTYFETVAPYWRRIFQSPDLHSATWVHLLEHHDETFMGFFGAEVRTWLGEYIKTHKGMLYKNGMSAGGRIADCLNNNAERIATALFILYITPGTPMVYAGTEIGVQSNHDHASQAADVSFETFRKLGVYVEKKACFDPRELQRGAIPRSLFRKAVDSGYAGVEMVRTMNRIRREGSWLCGNEVEPLDSGDVGVLCMGRSGGGVKKICLANLTGCDKEVVMARGQVEGFLGEVGDGELVDLWGCKVEVGVVGVCVWLKAFQRAVVGLVGG